MAENRPERLKAALRENLKRRKAQARGRDEAGRGGRRRARARRPRRRGRRQARLSSAELPGRPVAQRIEGKQWTVSASPAAAPLNGSIPISGAKNAALPLMIASLLTEETLELTTCRGSPTSGCCCASSAITASTTSSPASARARRRRPARRSGSSARTIIDTTAPYELVSTMRASFWVIAPLLARLGEAQVSLPGGCAIGTRPVDLLLMALERLGAKIEIDAGYVVARAPKGLKGGEIVFPKVTVGGTHVALMAATLASGTTVIENAAREPEVADLADCLIKMGARIDGAGTAQIVVEGVARLHGARHEVLPDRIETGTYAMAVAMTGGDVLLENARPDLLQSALDVLGAGRAPRSRRRTRASASAATATASQPVDVTTDPFPGFPTDLQAQFMALMTRAERHLAHPRDDLREPLHACAGARPARRPHPPRRRSRRWSRASSAEGRAGDGDRSARLGVAGDRRPCGRGRDDDQPHLSPRPRLRGAGGEAPALRRRIERIRG